jgi:serine/threonine protein kinase
MTIKYKNKNKYNTKTKSIKGGKVIASGGFGCVFSPALKCKGKTKREKNKISKLLTKKHATSEYQEIIDIKEKLDSIPNYKDYFVIYDINLCEPAPLTKSDLEKFKSECSALPKNDIEKKNINEKLDEILSLNIPNGGIAIDDFIYKNGSLSIVKKLNKSLINLLKNGIIPMNKKNVYHSDIKDSNILADDKSNELKTRLIDWGLTTEYTPFINAPFPKSWRNRPFQFNVPFSIIIFSDAFVQKYSNYLKDGGKKDKTHLKPFVIDFISFWMKERGPGHYKFINEIMYMLFSKNLTNMSEESLKIIIETEFTMSYITDYIIEVLINFTEFRKDGTLNLRKYLDNIFIENIDIWGFCSAYFPFLEILFNNYDKLNEIEMNLFNIIKSIFVKVYTTRVEKININEIIEKLEMIDKLLSQNINESSDSNNLGKGISKKTKLRIFKSKLSFKRKTNKKRFKKPIFLSLK